MDPALEKIIGAGGLILAANRRLAAHLEEDAGRTFAARGLYAWPRPRTATPESYLAALWEGRWENLPVIPPKLSELLWERIVAADAESSGVELPDPRGAAAQAAQAHSLMALYRIPAGELSDGGEESAAFARWRKSYLAEVEARGWIDPASLSERLAELFRTGRLAAEPLVGLAGFDEHPPARRELLEAMVSAGSEMIDIPFPVRAGAAGRWRAPDREGEVRAAARWALGILRRNPSARIGVVAVRMEEYRDWLEREFERELHPEEALNGAPYAPLFDMSLGAPLEREGVAETALGLVSLAVRRLPIAEVKKLLLSPYFLPSIGPDEKARLAARLAGAGVSEADARSLSALFSSMAQGGASNAAVASKAFEELARAGEGEGKPPSVVAAGFSSALDAVGWGNPSGLVSREYQAVEKFRSALASVSIYDSLPPFGSPRWVASRIAEEAREPFRPLIGGAPVTMLGLLESGGLAFDHLWLLGAHDGAWPPPSRPNPFIPVRVQLAHGVRQASPEEALSRARAITARVLASAGEAVVSHPAAVDETEASLSPLFAHIPLIEPDLDGDFTPAAQVAARGRATLAAREDAAPPLEPGEELKGGASLLSAQAKCPFMAFARYRLGVRESSEEALGVDPRNKGAMLHDALHHLHGLLPNRDAIVGATAEARSEAIRESLAKARKTGFSGGIRGRLLDVELRRIGEVLEKWLEAECARPGFEVLERETVRDLLAGGIPISLRIDRIDVTGDGQMILDYKTGKVPSGKSLRSERLTEPQLPLYALACPEAVGVAWAGLDRGGCTLTGHKAGEGEGRISGVEDWDALKAAWRSSIDNLGAELAEGFALPDPEGRRRHCKNCGLTPLCRVTDHESGEAEDGEEEGAS